MNSEQHKILREPFHSSQIGKLPRPTRKDAEIGNCTECGKRHKLPAVHLDYVGHAAVTDRLLRADPDWNWEPLAYDTSGLPYLLINADGAPVGLWIKLTVCGVTRLGYGSVESGALDAEKQLISDALRNAAMRFGVGLDLWAKEDLHGDESPEKTENGQQPRTPAKQNTHAVPFNLWLKVSSNPQIFMDFAQGLGLSKIDILENYKVQSLLDIPGSVDEVYYSLTNQAERIHAKGEKDHAQAMNEKQESL
jgi:hypothetical protein